MSKRCAVSIVLLLTLFAFEVLVAQTAPPTLQLVYPNGGQRGAKVSLRLEGTNIGGASELIFSELGFSAKITEIKELPVEKPKIPKGVVVTSARIEDKARKYRATAILTIAPDAPVGVHALRLRTPLGVSNLAPFAVGSLPETREQFPNTPQQPQKISLPTTIVGELSMAGDIDAYRFTATSGQETVFRVVARSIGSQADTILRLFDSKGQHVAENNDLDLNRDSVLAYKFPQAGIYVLTVEDAEQAGGDRYDYRIDAGVFPYVTAIFPLGVRKGTSAAIKIRGFNLGKTQYVDVKGQEPSLRGTTIPLVVETPLGPSLNRPRLALGEHSEVFEKEPNDDIAGAQSLTLPSTVNGQIFSGADEQGADEQGADRDLYRFRARKGQKLVFEVMAQRLGSPLDSVLEILYPDSKPVPRATVRCIAQTSVTLNDPDASRSGIRLASWNDFAINDYVMIGEEIIRVREMPTHPDADMIFRSFRGPRVGFFDTTPGNHAVNTPVYKVEVHPFGTQFPPNGMPIFYLHYRNDDGGPMFGGKDSRLHFTAPADSEYLLRIRDVRDIDGESFSYRLTAREPAPDFDVTFDPKLINIPQGGRVSLLVTATHQDGFEGPIEVELRNLPEGITATAGLIPSGADTATILLAAREDTSLEKQEVALKSTFLSSSNGNGEPATWKVQGLGAIKLLARANIESREVVREGDPEEPVSVIALAPKPDLVVKTDVDTVELTAGKSTTLTVQIERHNGFTGRVPISVLNMPHGVRVDDIGLNGIMVTEEETSRTFHLVAESWVAPTTQPLLVVGRVEVNSPLRNEHAALPVKLVVKPAVTATN